MGIEMVVDGYDRHTIFKTLERRYDNFLGARRSQTDLINTMIKLMPVFGFVGTIIGLINAFKLGAPPHGGLAPGIDRIVMLIADESNIREVIAFPMNQKAEDLLMNAPGEVDFKQLRELHLKINLPKKQVENDQ